MRNVARLSGALAGVGLLAGCGAAPTAVPPSARVYRVGQLSTTTESGELDEVSSGELIGRLGELGYREGENLTIEHRGVSLSTAPRTRTVSPPPSWSACRST